eukprot:TRINITY_DN28548_c0_g1_i1.p1 TRINITY_DN28548_c0_g1~~TRINITY_DN28548_c0_g1_i1.p1  ORF type:complete len:104 (-),score=35.73 TRINITY_DN28548_c0_g1_i1:17-304(-)
MEYSNGSSYEGGWSRGVKHGKGKMIYADGSEYEGEWVFGERHGTGMYKDVAGVYNGKWQDDKKHGENGRWCSNFACFKKEIMGEWRNGEYIFEEN